MHEAMRASTADVSEIRIGAATTWGRVKPEPERDAAGLARG